MLFMVLLPLLAALFVPLLSKHKHKIHTGFYVLLIPFTIFCYFIRYPGEAFSPIAASYPWVPSMDINLDFYLDGLSLLFVLLISGIGTLVTLYSVYYLDKSERLHHFYVYLLIFMTAMLGIVLSDNVFVLYGFWELTSISSFLLIGYWNNRDASRYGAQKSMLITVFGGLSMLGGFILLATVTGTTSIQGMIEQREMVLESAYLPLILSLVLLGAFTKSAQFPFHIWLPDAMEAPTPVSAYLHSATMVKAGIFLVARFFPLFSAYEWFFIAVTGAGIITLCWASYMAVRQTDLKAILAFSTVSQLGMIMAMLGYGTETAVFAAVFHILNHATFKGSLFMIAGIVDHETGTRDIRKLGGLLTLLPVSATLALFGAFSMAGFPLPFLNGFYSKELFFESSLHLNETTLAFAGFLREIVPYLAVFGSIFTFVYSMYLWFGTFTGEKKFEELPKKPHEAPVGMLLSPAILVLGVVIIGVIPNFFNEVLLTFAASAVANAEVEVHVAYWHGWDFTAFHMSLLVVALGTLLYIFRKKWWGIYQRVPGKFSFNHVYNKLVAGLEMFSRKFTGSYMNGSLRWYLSLIVTAIVVVSFIVMAATNGFAFETDNLAEVSIAEILIAVMMAVAAVATIFASSRIAAILVLGVVGYGLAILFVLYRAPDLALTQLSVETITVALFLLCFRHFPALAPRSESAADVVSKAALSIGMGGLLTMVAISAHSSKWFPSISEYFLEFSHELGGGDNVVNVILVDFRGLDTLFEITVLGIAALSIYTMIKFRRKKEAD